MQTLATDMYRVVNDIPTKFRKMFSTFVEKKAINENLRIFFRKPFINSVYNSICDLCDRSVIKSIRKLNH